MYLWKYWRESRILFGACMLGITLLFVMVVRAHFGIEFGGSQEPVDPNSAVLPFPLMLQALPVAFVAWLMGSFGVGRDLGERSGSYLFSRPRSRSFFLWSDWRYGMAQLLVIVILLNLVLGRLIYGAFARVESLFQGNIMLSGKPVTAASIIGLNCVAAFLLAALVFSLTYFSTVLIKNSKGLMLAVGLLLGYLILKAVVKHYWPGIELPTLIPKEFSFSGGRISGFAAHLGLFTAIRAAVILLFPLAAQLVLERTDI